MKAKQYIITSLLTLALIGVSQAEPQNNKQDDTAKLADARVEITTSVDQEQKQSEQRAERQQEIERLQTQPSSSKYKPLISPVNFEDYWK